MIFKAFIAVCLFGLSVFPVTFNAQVVRVIDGDTIHVIRDNQDRVKVRLFGIDAPELNQRDGAASGRYLSVRIGDQSVQIVSHGYDDYGRLLGEVIDSSGVNINEEMVRYGLAWVYRRYVKTTDWLTLEKTARAHGAGLWRRRHPVPPWQHRKNN